jgi:uncharacterized membrane protein YeaQ/YmgE (transglycosylase-associated protein family)
MGGLLWFLFIGLVAGWLTGLIMRGGGYGIFGDLILGVIGAFVGRWLFGVLGVRGQLRIHWQRDLRYGWGHFAGRSIAPGEASLDTPRNEQHSIL